MTWSTRVSSRPPSSCGTVAEAPSWDCPLARGKQGTVGSVSKREVLQLLAVVENRDRVIKDSFLWGICVVKNQCSSAKCPAYSRVQVIARFGDTMTWEETHVAFLPHQTRAWSTCKLYIQVNEICPRIPGVASPAARSPVGGSHTASPHGESRLLGTPGHSWLAKPMILFSFPMTFFFS